MSRTAPIDLTPLFRQLGITRDGERVVAVNGVTPTAFILPLVLRRLGAYPFAEIDVASATSGTSRIVCRVETGFLGTTALFDSGAEEAAASLRDELHLTPRQFASIRAAIFAAQDELDRRLRAEGMKALERASREVVEAKDRRISAALDGEQLKAYEARRARER